MPPLRLRIPPALAVALLGGAATMTMSFLSCHEEPVPPDPDAGQITFERDGGLDGHVGSTGDVLADDVVTDAAVADGALDARPDAPPGPPPDAPDTPVG